MSDPLEKRPDQVDRIERMLKRIILLLESAETVVGQQRTDFSRVGEGRDDGLQNLKNLLQKQYIRSFLYRGAKGASDVDVTKYGHLLSDNPNASKTLATALDTRQNKLPATIQKIEEAGYHVVFEKGQVILKQLS